MVELPLAAPTIMAGLRIATVTTIGTATIAAAIGGGGLGVFIFRGIASVDKYRFLRARFPPRCWRSQRMARSAGWRNGAPCAELARLAASPCCCAPARSEPRIRVGSKNFTEQLILGEIVAQHLETACTARQPQAQSWRHTAGASGAGDGDIDVYPEYTGTALTAVLKKAPVRDPARVLAEVREVIGNGISNGWIHSALRIPSPWRFAFGRMRPESTRFRSGTGAVLEAWRRLRIRPPRRRTARAC